MSEKYEPSQVEDKFYKIWEDRGYFEIDGNKSIQEHDASGIWGLAPVWPTTWVWARPCNQSP